MVTVRFALLIVLVPNLILFMVLSFIHSHEVLAGHLEPRTKTNINKTTNLFKESLGDYGATKNKLEQDKAGAINSLGNGSTVAKDLTEITGKNTSEIKSKASELDSINAAELSSKGRKQMIKEKAITSLHVDYSKPLNKQHLRDAERIGVAQDKLLNNLLSKLKDIGVDCKNVRGNKIVVPEYKLQIKEIKKERIDYNKSVCESPRRKYICHDFLEMKCIQKGKTWGEWQDKTMNLSGTYIYWKHYWWTCQHRHNLGWGKYMHFIRIRPHKDVQKDIQHTIAAKHGVSSDHIHPYIEAKDGGSGETIYVRWRDYVYPYYIFNYKYRDRTKPSCELWQEKWEQQCQIQ